jgi:hypothetical protein
MLKSEFSLYSLFSFIYTIFKASILNLAPFCVQDGLEEYEGARRQVARPARIPGRWQLLLKLHLRIHWEVATLTLCRRFNNI